MEKFEVLFDAVQPTLDEAHIEKWKSTDFDMFVSLLTEYHRTRRNQQQQDEKAEATEEGHHHHGAGGALCCGGDHAHGEDGEHDAFPYLPSQEEVAVVDRQLVKIKHYLNRTVPFGSLDEPTEVEDNQKREKKKAATATTPVTAATTTEMVVAPPVFSVDAFLLEEEDVVELVQQGKLPREYCKHCGSTQIGLTDFISHSFSRDQMVYISCFLLPFLNEQTLAQCQRPVETMAEVGARFGGLLWAALEAKKVQRGDVAAVLPFLKRLVGIELDHKMVELERSILKRFFAPARPGGADPLPCACDLIESDCFQGDGAAALRAADVLVLHNVFEYFVKSPAEHLGCWRKLRQVACRSGQLLVCAPSLEETFGAFDEAALQVLSEDNKNNTTTTTDTSSSRKRARSSNGKDEKEGGDATSASLHPVAAAWLASYVVPVDVDALQEAFVSFRTGPMGCGGCEDEGCCGGEEGGGCEEEEGDAQSFVGELKELVANIHVYRVI